MKTITFYHSFICPRCYIASRSLSSLLNDFPDIELEKVEMLTNKDRARKDDVYSIPALVSGDKKISGFYLSKKKIRRFLESL